ncbi:MAG: type II secretion system protein GspM [Acidiferrobacter sp.]
MKGVRRLWERGLWHWAARTEKERRLVVLIALVVVPLLFLSFVWRPLAARVAHWERVLPKQRLALVQMRHEARLVQSLRAHAGHAPTGTALLSFIEQSAQSAAIANTISQLSPRGSHKAEAVFTKVPFNALVRFLAELGAHGISVVRVELTPAGVGIVSGSVTWAASA